MPITPEELARRLVAADRMLRVLRQATIDMRKLGNDVRAARRKAREETHGSRPR